MVKKGIRRVLLTNDDGIDAPGIALLEQAARLIADEVWVIAPAVDKSGVSNGISLREPLRVSRRGERHYAVYGTPADCVALAVNQIMKEALPDLVLSGVNSGSNLGFETLLSGTVGAAMTGMLMGIPSIALSQNERADGALDWSCSKRYLAETLKKLTALSWDTSVCLSVNFPGVEPDGVKGIKVTAQGRGNVEKLSATETCDPHGESYYWIRIQEGEPEALSDGEILAVQQGYITLTPLTYERTARSEFDRLSTLIG